MSIDCQFFVEIRKHAAATPLRCVEGIVRVVNAAGHRLESFRWIHIPHACVAAAVGDASGGSNIAAAHASAVLRRII